MKSLNKEVKNRIKSLLIVLFAFSLPIVLISPAQASDAQMKAKLVRIINQLQSIKPLISQAKREQPANPRIKVHFDRFRGADDKWHYGLRQDIDSIQQALIKIVNKESVEPRQFQAIKDDFIGQ